VAGSFPRRGELPTRSIPRLMTQKMPDYFTVQAPRYERETIKIRASRGLMSPLLHPRCTLAIRRDRSTSSPRSPLAFVATKHVPVPLFFKLFLSRFYYLSPLRHCIAALRIGVVFLFGLSACASFIVRSRGVARTLFRRDNIA